MNERHEVDRVTAHDLGAGRFPEPVEDDVRDFGKRGLRRRWDQESEVAAARGLERGAPDETLEPALGVPDDQDLLVGDRNAAVPPVSRAAGRGGTGPADEGEGRRGENGGGMVHAVPHELAP